MGIGAITGLRDDLKGRDRETQAARPVDVERRAAHLAHSGYHFAFGRCSVCCDRDLADHAPTIAGRSDTLGPPTRIQNVRDPNLRLPRLCHIGLGAI
jgi:hypothetical protein